jgi:hypothetical protein
VYSAIHSRSRDEILLASTTISSQVALLYEEIKVSPTTSQPGNCIKSATARKSRQPTSKLRKLQILSPQRHTTLFGTLYIRRRRRPSNQSSFQDSGTVEVGFIPSFFSRCIEIQYSNSFGVIDGAIRIYPLLSDDHPAFTICEIGDIVGLQACFSTGSLSPYSVDKFGRSLLHVSHDLTS